MENKKWYYSQTVWACAVAILNSFLGMLIALGTIPAKEGGIIMTFIGTVAGVVGINGRMNANTKIG